MAPPDELAMLRKQIIAQQPGAEDEAARPRRRARTDARRIDSPRTSAQTPDDIRALLIAASVTAAFTAVTTASTRRGAGAEVTHERALAIVDEVFEFLRGGLDRLRSQGSPS